MTKRLIAKDKAFEEYYALGEGRSLSKLHDHLSRKYPKSSPSYPTLKNWSKSGSWQDRVLLRDNAVREGLQEAASAVVVEAKINELAQLSTAYNEIEAVKPLIINTLQSKKAAKIVPESTQELASLYNALSRLDSVQVKIVETVRKIRGESDNVNVKNVLEVRYEDLNEDARE